MQKPTAPTGVLACRASSSSRAVISGEVFQGKKASSQVDTALMPREAQSSKNGSMSVMSDSRVRTTTSGMVASSTPSALSEMVTPSGSVSPATSPRSRPTSAGSVSIAPTISAPLSTRYPVITRAMFPQP